jgi:hypothetical protein
VGSHCDFSVPFPKEAEFFSYIFIGILNIPFYVVLAQGFFWVYAFSNFYIELLSFSNYYF